MSPKLDFVAMSAPIWLLRRHVLYLSSLSKAAIGHLNAFARSYVAKIVTGKIAVYEMHAPHTKMSLSPELPETAGIDGIRAVGHVGEPYNGCWRHAVLQRDILEMQHHFLLPCVFATCCIRRIIDAKVLPHWEQRTGWGLVVIASAC